MHVQFTPLLPATSSFPGMPSPVTVTPPPPLTALHMPAGTPSPLQPASPRGVRTRTWLAPISLPAPTWGPEVHARFPPAHRAAVRTLLLAHARPDSLLAKVPKDVLVDVLIPHLGYAAFRQLTLSSASKPAGDDAKASPAASPAFTPAGFTRAASPAVSNDEAGSSQGEDEDKDYDEDYDEDKSSRRLSGSSEASAGTRSRSDEEEDYDEEDPEQQLRLPLPPPAIPPVPTLLVDLPYLGDAPFLGWVAKVGRCSRLSLDFRPPCFLCARVPCGGQRVCVNDWNAVWCVCDVDAARDDARDGRPT